jgi:hypothetical protein
MKPQEYLKPLTLLGSFHLISLALLHNITAFAPDEKNYLAIFKVLYRSDFSMNGFPGWPADSENIVRILYLPAKVLNVLGLSELLSLRLQAFGYTFCTALMLYALASKTLHLKVSTTTWLTFGLFIPSVFLWGTLGLRENLISFFLVGFFYTVSKYLQTNSYNYLMLCLLTLMGLYIVKGYLFIILFISIVIVYACLTLKIRKVKKQFSFVVILFAIPLMAFPTITATNFESARYFMVWSTQVETNSVSPDKSFAATLDEPETNGQTVRLLYNQIEKNPLFFYLASKTGLYFALEKALSVPTDGAVGETRVGENLKLNFDAASLGEPLSILRGSVRFLFSPVPFIDNGSLFLNLLSYESFLWYLIYFVFVALMSKKIFWSSGEFFLKFSLILFTSNFIVASALIEVNAGTSLRHRSVLLFCILIAIAIAEPREQKHARQ